MTTIARNEARTVRIRLATAADAEAICDIYAPYVQNTAITFDMRAPDVDETRAKIAATLAARPFLVAEEIGAEVDPNAQVESEGECAGAILGYAYASAFRPREAYIHAIETSIYLRPEAKGLGLGRRLYTALENILRLQNITTANACISSVEPADEYSPDNSRIFHERMGYELCGRIPHCGRKFDRWYDIIWMQKDLIDPASEPSPFIPLPQLDAGQIEAILQEA